MLSAPDDYGLTPDQTLAHRIDAIPPADFAEAFDVHWAAFRETFATLPTRWQGRVDSPTNQVVIRSLDSVRIAARVTMPDEGAEPRGIVVTSHGYSNVPDDFDDEPERWTALGLATVRVRVRGYPPSTADIDDLRAGGAWITHRLPHSIDSAGAWVVRGAVADIMQTVNCARSHFGESLPVTLHGESLGGGLATIAAAQLTRMGRAPDRLVLALPTFGDWRWRALRYCNGSGALVNIMLDALRNKDRDNMLLGLLLYDAALHASVIEIPTLTKLALRDDVVPAPSAAAVYNALATLRKWRFITPYGHFDGGLADCRRHVLFERLQTAFADPADAPEQVMSDWADSLDWPRIAVDSPSGSRV